MVRQSTISFSDCKLTLRVQMIMRQQDETLDTIGGTLTTIQQQAGLIGQEVNEHNECVYDWCCSRPGKLSGCRMLSDVERGVDQADSKLNDAMTKMKKFIRETEGQYRLASRFHHAEADLQAETKSGWCIGILIFILLCLLVAVIFI